jgi:NAD(P)-dependent dehydrogenase (short-subunit alcohol dehydrogenase family)
MNSFGSSLLISTGIAFWSLVAIFVAGKIWESLRSRQKLEFDGRWVLVTGCDSGIGLGVVKKLVAANAAVSAFTLTTEGADRALQAGARLALQLDLTDEKAVAAAVEQVKISSGGKLWGLVHNAGAVLPGFIEYQRLENFRKIMEVNFFAVARLTQALIPALKSSQGRVVIISSVDGIVSLPGNAPYDASKFAVEAYADALRVELSFWGVEVSVVNPATMRTPLALGFFEGHKKSWELMEAHEPDGVWKQAYPRDWLDVYVPENSKRLESMAQSPQNAIDDIFHALTAKTPKMRYLSGALAKTLFFALWKMPERWAFHFKKGIVNPQPRLEG